jgi:hypothetical protein
MTQGIKEQVGAVAAIESELHFRKVGLQMLSTDAMPRSDDAALQETKRILNRIGMNIAVNVDASDLPPIFSPEIMRLSPVFVRPNGLCA